MQTDVIKQMLQKPILSGRIGKWAYALVEYDLACEPLKFMRCQIVADFFVEHRINDKVLTAIISHFDHQLLGNKMSFTPCSVHILLISNKFQKFWMSCAFRR